MQATDTEEGDHKQKTLSEQSLKHDAVENLVQVKNVVEIEMAVGLHLVWVYGMISEKVVVHNYHTG